MRAVASILLVLLVAGCAGKPRYPTERIQYAPPGFARTIAVAPVVNLSGQRSVDPILQADLVFQELQKVTGLTVIPVNRTAEAMIGLGISSIDSPAQAQLVCQALGVEAVVVGTITLFDPYDPPRVGASLQMMRSGLAGQSPAIDVASLRRRAAETQVEPTPANADFIQVVGMFDASDGSVRERVSRFSRGRTDPAGPLGEREVYLSSDRYAAFVWHELIGSMLRR